MINRAKLQHILEYAKQQRNIGLHCKVPPEDMVEIVEAAMLQGDERVTTVYKLPEGYALVPVEPTREMMAAFALGADDIEYEPGKRWEDGECWYAEVNDADSFVSAYRCMLESVSIEGK